VDRFLSHFFFQGRFLTTNYRWLNKFIIRGLQIIKHLPQAKPVEKPIYIVGTGRSGSTILGKVLSMHKDIGFLNEPKAMWYCIDPHDDVNGHFQLGSAKYTFSEQDVTDEKREAAERLFAFYLEIVRSNRILDKNPEIVYRLPYVKKIFPDAKFIFLVRNGWDTVHSISTWSRQARRINSGHIEDWWGLDRRKWKLMVKQLLPEEPLLVDRSTEISAFDSQEDMAAVEWIIAMQRGLREVKNYSDSIIITHYERLIQNPIYEVKRLTNFCELGDDRVLFSYAEEVFSANEPKSRLEISPVVQSAFQSTMKSLNYPSNSR
jgi:hypothetical protein